MYVCGQNCALKRLSDGAFGVLRSVCFGVYFWNVFCDGLWCENVSVIVIENGIVFGVVLAWLVKFSTVV